MGLIVDPYDWNNGPTEYIDADEVNLRFTRLYDLVNGNIDEANFSSTALEELGHGIYDIARHGAVSDGSTDDYAAIIDARDAASAAGGGIVYLPPGTTVTNSDIPLVDNVYFRGAGRGTSILKAGGNDNVFTAYAAGPTNLGVSDLTIQGNLAYNAYGFNLSGGLQDAFFARVEVKDLNIAGVVLGDGSRRCYFEDVWVRNINGTTGAGIWVFHDVQDCWLNNIHTYDTGGAGVILDAGTNDALGEVIENVHLSNIHVSNCSQEHPASGGIMFEGAQRCTLTNFSIRDSGAPGVIGHGLYLNRDQADIGSDHNAISNGVIKGTRNTPIRVAASSHNVISNIDIEDVATGGSDQYPINLVHQGWSDDVTDNLFSNIKARAGTGAITAGVRFGDGAGNFYRNRVANLDVGTAPLTSVHGSATAYFSSTSGNWVDPTARHQLLMAALGESALQTGVAGDGQPRWQVSPNSTGAYVWFGDGTNPVDTNLYRPLADCIKSDDQAFFPAGVTTKTKAGAPTDADFINDLDGSLVIDTTNHRLYFRSGGAWKYAQGV